MGSESPCKTARDRAGMISTPSQSVDVEDWTLESMVCCIGFFPRRKNKNLRVLRTLTKDETF
jgi:hypothetical protein